MSGLKSAEQRRWVSIVRWAVSTIALVLLALAGWIRFHFGPVSFEQIVTNLPISGGAEGVGDNSLLLEAVIVCLVVPIGLSTLIAIVSWARRRRPRTDRPARRRPLLVPTLALTVALGVLFTVAGVPQYASAALDTRTIADYYVRPSVMNSPERPKNLITIYLESTENTFGDESIFGQNLLANLDQATEGWARYDSLQQYPTGGWTMAGIVGTQCGIPLKSKLLTVGINSNTLGEQVDHFLPGATCLGDVLAAQGYTNAFVGGAHARFAGKDTYFRDHGYSLVQGLDDWEADGEDRSNISVWGLSDARLFERAKTTLRQLRSSGEPFNLTVLTMDTHEPPGVFPSCNTDDPLAMYTALKCSGRAVAGFLEYLKEHDYLDDTVVVLMGDHLKNTGDSDDLRTELIGATERTILLRVWSPDGVHYARENADQLSLLPTTLELLGFRLSSGRAGLGVSFASGHDLDGSALTLPQSDYQSLLEAPSGDLYQKLWQS